MKKRIRCFLLLLLAFFIPCQALAEYADPKYDPIHEAFANHTIEDLLTLQKMVEIELEYRGHATEQKEVTVPPGKYTVGTDIPANVYSLVLNGGIISMIMIKDADGGLGGMYTLSPTIDVGKVELTDGQTIEISGEPVIFKPYKGLDF